MNIDLPPQYDPKSVEAATYQSWLASGAFHATPDAAGAPARPHFSIVIPPPNVTGALHLGHAINGTIQDILTRYHRMKGDNTLWMPGIDHAGIATQAVVERTIFEKEGKNRHDLGREELVRRIWEWKQQYGDRIISQQQSLGASCDWARTRFTLDDICARAVREAFFKMFKDGLIFRGKRLVNWDTHLQTAVADDEIYRETVRGQMTSIKYPIEGIGDRGEGLEFLVVATTRPETMLGDTAVAVHPDDPRYKHLIGKQVIVPLVGRRIPIIADGLLVDPAFGTGVVKVTPAHDPNDYATGQRHGLEQINLLTADGRVNENGAGAFNGKEYSYVGLKFASEARKRVLADLEALDLIAEAKPHEHEVGHSDRSKTPIEPYLSDQWFVRMNDHHSDGKPIYVEKSNSHPNGLAQLAIDAVISERIAITPRRYRDGYLAWLGQKRDWCISRQLWWGHRIPVWSQRGEPGDRERAFKRTGIRYEPGDSADIAAAGFEITPEMRPYVAGQVFFDDEGVGTAYICIGPGRSDLEAKFSSDGFSQDPDVLDTWFSSALWPISTMGWPANGTSDKPEDQLLPVFYPTSVLSTARDILTLWVARMVMFGLYCRGNIPFEKVYVHPVIQDGEGRQMSKSKGNGVDPVEIINSHGADGLRFTLAQMTTETQDIRMPVQLICPHCGERFPNPASSAEKMNCPKCKKPITRSLGTATGSPEAPLARTTSDRFDLGRNFANKIWNASRFILSSIDESVRHLSESEIHELSHNVDRWIMLRLDGTIKAVEKSILEFKFADLANCLYQFFWNDLCDWYLEISKGRLKSGDTDAQAVLLYCLRTSLKLLHPIMPFITEAIWSKLPMQHTMLVTSDFPRVSGIVESAREMMVTTVQEVVTAIRDIHNAYPVAKGKPVYIRPKGNYIESVLITMKSAIEGLTGNTIAEISIQSQKAPDSAVRILKDGSEIYIGGVVDPQAEIKKLTKRKDELLKIIPGNKAKLENQGFMAKAPEKVVAGLRETLAAYEAELATIEKNLAELSA